MVSRGLPHVSTGAAKWSAYASAVLILISTGILVGIIVESRRDTSSDCDFSTFRAQVADWGNDQNTNCITEEWDIRRKFVPSEIAFDIINAVGAFFLIPPVLSFAELYGSQMSEVKFLVPSIIIGSIVNGLQLVIRAGLHNTASWLSSDSWNLSPDGLRSLTISYFIAQGQGVWMFALDELLLGIGLIAAAVLVFRHGRFPKAHAWVGVIAGVLAVINFFLELARFGSWRLFSVVGGISMAVVGLVLLPVWLIIFACSIDSASHSSNPSALMHTELGDAEDGIHDGADGVGDRQL